MTLPATTPWLQDPGALAVAEALGGKVFFVGGCVRDAVLGIEGSDIDMATPLRPEDVTARAETAGLKVVPTGIGHGTVTVVSAGHGYEITTFRRDVETDGRRAVVTFSEDIGDDARRRDFTLNALYATPGGIVVDPLGSGLADCLARRIRFIEDAETRIREDYLRILRYFRFCATYARPDEGFDPDALDAVARCAGGISRLSAERIGGEVTRLLSAPDPAPAVAAMRATGCLAEILPGAEDRLLGPVVHLEAAAGCAPDAMLRLAALGGDAPEERLRLSREDARVLRAMRDAGYGAQPLSAVGYRDGARIGLAAAILRAALAGQPLERATRAAVEKAARAVFPVRARDLMPRFEGKALGAELARLEARWIASDFSLSREDLLAGH